MKGIVFTEFVEMVENQFTWQVAESIIEECNLESGGAYTSVGTYDHDEIIRLVGALSRRTQIGQTELVKAFGKYLFGRFSTLYAPLFAGVNSAFDFISSVDKVIHVEVRKLYPDAELPTLEARTNAEGALEVRYRSSRPFADLAEGLIIGCAEYFEEDLMIKRRPLEDGSNGCVFVLQQTAVVAI
jgi:hypothetical protein